MATIKLTWILKYYNIDFILENRIPNIDDDRELEHILDEFKKLNINWSLNKNLDNLDKTKSQAVALSAIYSLKR